MTFKMIGILVLIAIATYVTIAGRFKPKLILIETVRIIAPLSKMVGKTFGLISIVFSKSSELTMNFSDDVKSFEERTNLEDLKQKELQNEEFGNAIRILLAEYNALKEKDEKVDELLHQFAHDPVSGSYKFVFNRFMEVNEGKALLRKLYEVGNQALENNTFKIIRISAPRLIVGRNGIYASIVSFELKANLEASERRVARYQERENSEVEKVESVL